MSDLGFRAMALTFKVRDFFSPRIDILKEAGIKEGHHVLDFGCGSGSYLLAVAELVGKSGKINALDVQSLAIEMVKKIAAKNKLTNVETILSDRETGLADESIDVALLYDVFHDLADPEGVLKELHRVLKVDGILSLSDHHMKHDEILSKVTNENFFRLLKKGEKTYSFARVK
ncbi:MAG TPA: class I SAM-dependent methyltransferase [Candidatus Bathyarchaeia archaeon]|nr:class I SAM-dependent methyltransferase [Candidatus Bathyarchaeia archaeon]